MNRCWRLHVLRLPDMSNREEEGKQPHDHALDFEHAQYAGQAPVGLTCTTCGSAPKGNYYSVNGATTCVACLETLQANQQGSFVKALGMGLLAGGVGALVYYGIRAATGYDLAIITIALGVIVGIAVRRGAGARRSILYRLMALGIAWVSMCVTYVPMIATSLVAPEPAQGEEAAADDVNVAEADDEAGIVPPPTAELAPEPGVEAPMPSGVAYAVAGVLSLAVPFLLAFEFELLGVLIFALGLWEAWKRSAASPFEVAGPFQLEPGSEAPAAP